MRQTIIDFPLLTNGLDFIKSALEQLEGKPLERNLKYAIIHLSAGIELILKERLKCEHWTLLFEKIQDATKLKYEEGNFTSVTFNSCLDRLSNICGIDIPQSKRDNLKKFRDKRNRIEHFGVTGSLEAFKASAATALDFILNFINTELKLEHLESEDLDILVEIRQKLNRFESFVLKRMNNIQQQLNSHHTAILICPDCGQKTLLLEDGSHCLFCGYKILNPQAAAEEYVSNYLGISEYETVTNGGEWPIYICPQCGVNALVNTEYKEFACFNCGISTDDYIISFCESCGEPYLYSEQDSISICSNCYDYKFYKND